MSYLETVFPFTAIVGQEKMKKALILNAVNWNLGGLLIRGEKGTAKSTAVRSLARLLPEIEVIDGCPFNCDPAGLHGLCSWCEEKRMSGKTISSVKRKMRVVDLPLNSTEDRVVGTMDIERAIGKGERAYEPGILAMVNRGILYVDEVNLLDDHIVDVLLDSAAMGRNYVEREGISFSHDSRFILIGTMNPEEGDLRPQLLDRFGLCIDVEGVDKPDERISVIERYMQYENDPESFYRLWENEEKSLADEIVKAREMLPHVSYGNDMYQLIVNISLDMNVDGHRADIFMLKTAKTLAAYHNRLNVIEEDVHEAAELVLKHRMRKQPFQDSSLDSDSLRESLEKKKKSESGTDKRKSQINHGDKGDESSEKTENKEKVFQSADSYLLKELKSKKDKQVKSGSGRRSKVKSDDKRGRYGGRCQINPNSLDIAFDSTLRAAAPYQVFRQQKEEMAFILKQKDLRTKVREKKTGNTILFLVDSSGSMGASQRMSESKGAVLSLLKDAYKKRDKVGLVSFRGKSAEVHLPPTSNVEIAQKYLDNLPTGGKTPLSSGLMACSQVFKKELSSGIKRKLLLVLISDGKANVSVNLDNNPLQEACGIAEGIRKMGADSLIVDTERGFVRFRNLERISKILNGRYCSVDELKAGSVTRMIKETLNKVAW